MIRKENFKKIDYLTLGYLTIVILVITIFRQNLKYWKINLILTIFFIALIFFIIWLKQRTDNAFVKILRSWYPILLYTPLFEQTGFINRTIFPDYIDGFFIRLEYSIFGFHPAIELGNAFDHILIMEFFHLAYFSYYIIIPLLGLILYLQNKEQFEEYLFVNSFTFYTCLVVYLFLPVLGARYYANPPFFAGPFWKEGFLFIPVMRFIYRVGEVDGAAFPSSHVAVALIILIYTYLYAKKYFYAALFIIVSLIISTVYCRFHYVVDIIASFFWAPVTFYLGRKIYKAKPWTYQ